MSRYIDTDALEVDSEWNDVADCYTAVSMAQINATPTADVVEVVRCKDCRYYYSTEIATASIMCSHMHEDDFCSYGERRKEDEQIH